MIQQANLSVEENWQKELKQSFTKPEQLLNFLALDESDFAEDIKARDLFVMRVPKPFAKLMRANDPNDPLLRQVLPHRDEFINKPEFVLDPLVEQDAALPGLLHKYKSRVLIIFRGGCAINCRYCFRRHFPYSDNSVNKARLQEHIDYINKDPHINEVILSGGDPLMANDEHLIWFIKELETVKHVKRLRIHTRLPVVIPSRITAKLLNGLKASRLQVVMVLHINHPNEVGEELIARSHLIKTHGIWLLNQAVLLKGINNEITTQVALSEALFDAGIQPYYLHLLDKVAGVSHFDIDTSDVNALYQGMMAELPGFLLPRLVREIGGEPSKTPVLPY